MYLKVLNMRLHSEFGTPSDMEQVIIMVLCMWNGDWFAIVGTQKYTYVTVCFKEGQGCLSYSYRLQHISEEYQ